jgi:L-ascorbate metabolism protein UlaG (beta-lactamase superfamily)
VRRRTEAPPLPAGVDGVLVSHAHWDHLDYSTLRRLPRDTAVVVPRGLGRALRRRRFRDVRELSPGGRTEIGALAVEATHAEHAVGRWRGRSTDRAVGYIVRGSRSIYFAGDTDLFPGLAELGPVDLALLPVAGWGPRLPPGHLDSRSAAEALALLRPEVAVPIHWGTYASGKGNLWESAPEEFRIYAAEVAPDVEVRVLPVGGSIDV